MTGNKENRPVKNIYHTELSSLPNSFDPDIYTFINPEIKNTKSPSDHFMKHGYGEGRLWDVGMSYQELNKFLVEQDIFFDDDGLFSSK